MQNTVINTELNNIENVTAENIKMTYAGSLLQTSNAVCISQNQNFSKIIDNLNAKTNQVQSNFNSQAVKSNTGGLVAAGNNCYEIGVNCAGMLFMPQQV